jgi:hypothetical protein
MLFNELLLMRPGSIAVLHDDSDTVKSGLVWGTVTPSTRVRIPARALSKLVFGPKSIKNNIVQIGITESDI